MSDERLRELERKFRETGSPKDEEAFHAERKRHGEHVATLAGLDEVDWANLDHAYGPANDVPDQLRALRSPDPEVRKQTQWQLYGNVFHQGTRYPATPHAVPFLRDRLRDRFTPDRVWILYYMVHLALGYQEEHLPFGGAIDEWRSYASEADDTDPYARVFVDTFEAVEACVEDFVACLDAQEAQLQEVAVFALGWFPAKRDTSLPALRATIEKSEGVLRMNAILSYGMVCTKDEAAFLERFFDHEDPWHRRVAAMAYAIAARDEVPPLAMGILIEGLSADRDDQPDLPIQDGDVIGLLAAIVSGLGDEAQNSAIPAMVEALRATSGVAALNLASTLLSLAFNEPPTGPANLNANQRLLLEALAESPKAWLLGDHPFGNFSLLMHGYQLPGSCEELQTWLAG